MFNLDIASIELFKNWGNFALFVLFAAIFLFVIIYSFLQVRQIGILQKMVKTDADPIVKSLTYVYLLIQIALFVVALLIL